MLSAWCNNSFDLVLRDYGPVDNLRFRIDAERESSHLRARSVLIVLEYSKVGADKVLRDYGPQGLI